MNPLDTDEPLGLVVHSLPAAAAPQGAQVRGRWKLLALMLVCSLPVIAAYFAYFVVRPQGKAALGELLSPAHAVGALQGRSLQGQERALATLQGQWLLVSVGTGGCDADCQRRLYLMRQLRATLGEARERVDTVWLLTDTQELAPELTPLLANAHVLRVEASALSAWLQVPAGRAWSDYLFVVDPLGNAMMRLPARFDLADAAKARRDLERLLRASVSWDGPGR
ncbi:MAG: hypothetical protein ACT4NV_05585 [Rhodoferax sp.]